MMISDPPDPPLATHHNAKQRLKILHHETAPAFQPLLADQRNALRSIPAPSKKEKKRKQQETAQLRPSDKPGDSVFPVEGEAAGVLQVERGEGKRRKKKARQDDDKVSAVMDESMAHLMKKKKKKKKKEDRENDTFSVGNSSQASLQYSVNEADACDNAREQASRGDAAAIPAEPAGMEIYWKLASLDSNVRESAAVALVRELQAAQEVYENRGDKDRVAEELAEEVLLGSVKDDEGLQDCAPGVRYALRRLVRGVSSSRESARQGFAVALAAVVGTLSSIKGEAVLKLIKKNLEVTSSMKGQEARDGLLGQLFAAGAIVRAGRLVGDASTSEQANLANEVSELLLTLAKKKSFLREPAIAVLLDLIEKIPSSSLPNSVMDGPLFQEILRTEPEHGNADALVLALRLFGKPQIPLRHCPMLPESGIMHDFFVPSHLSSVVPCLKDSSRSHPRLHCVWSVLIELIFFDSSDLPLQRKTEGDRSSVKKKTKRRKSDKGELYGEQRSIEGRLKSFWSIVVDSALLTSSHERKHLALELLLLLLPRLSAAHIYIVLSNTFVRCLLDILAAKDTLLHKSAQRCLQELCQWASKDEQRLVAVVISLQQSSHGKFDNISKSETVRSMVTDLRSEKACFSYLHSLMDLFSQGQNKSVIGLLRPVDNVSEAEGSIAKNDNIAIENGEGLKEINYSSGINIESQRLWLVDQIYNFCRQAQVEQAVRVALVKEVVNLFVPLALFNVSPNMELTVKSSGEKMKWPLVPISENCRKLCLIRLQSLLGDSQHLSGPQKSKNISLEQDGSLMKKNSIEDLTVSFLHCYDRYGSSPSTIHVKPPSEEDGKTINALRSAAIKLSSVVQRAPKEYTEKLQSMCALITQLLLQSMKSHVNETAIELLICCRKAFGEFLKLEIEDEDEGLDSPAVMDVLMDILLSLLAQSSAPIRAAAEQVFRAFCDDLTERAFLSMLRVVKKQLRAARHRSGTAISDEDSDGDEILSIEDIEEDMVNENDMEDKQLREREAEQDRLVEESDVSSEGEDGDDYQKDGSGTQLHEMMQRKGLKLIKLKEKDEVANEPESDSDFDDEAMFRVDAHLAQILKQKKKAGDDATKDAKTQLLHFKFRVLSLIEFFVRKKSNSSLMLIALPHLLQAFVLSCSVDGNAQLADRIGSILHKKLFKAKQYPRNLNFDEANIEGLLQRSLKLAARSKIKRVGVVAQACSFWLLKVWHGYHPPDSSGKSEIVKIFEDALEDFFVQKKSRLTSNFFREAFVRYPWLGRSCLQKLLNKCTSARSEYLQYEAVVLVGSILRPKTYKETSESAEEDSESQSFKRHLSALIEVLVLLLQKPASKTARRSEAKRFCISTLKFLSRQYPDKILKDLIGDSAYNTCITLLGTSTFATLLNASTNPAALNISKSAQMNDRNRPLEEARLAKKQKKVGSRKS